VEQIRAAVAQVDRLEVCGAAYDGIGIAACVADGQRAATRVLAELRSGQE
jgi:oxygen-dependent protoporphyrinogen oxidase